MYGSMNSRNCFHGTGLIHRINILECEFVTFDYYTASFFWWDTNLSDLGLQGLSFILVDKILVHTHISLIIQCICILMYLNSAIFIFINLWKLPKLYPPPKKNGELPPENFKLVARTLNISHLPSLYTINKQSIQTCFHYSVKTKDN